MEENVKKTRFAPLPHLGERISKYRFLNDARMFWISVFSVNICEYLCYCGKFKNTFCPLPPWEPNFKNSRNWFLDIYICNILQQEPFGYMIFFPSRYGGNILPCEKHVLPPSPPWGANIENSLLKWRLQHKRNNLIKFHICIC